MKEISSVPLAYNHVDEESYIYKLGTLLRFLQNHIELIKGKPEIISANVFEYYNKNIQGITGKTLYLIKDELASDINTVAR
ncbi:MAG: hypothetical protein HC896_08745 [Bacteroidales bacterium]|nr:hypothetical protein [Bacteroidales bacterium]